MRDSKNLALLVALAFPGVPAVSAAVREFRLMAEPARIAIDGRLADWDSRIQAIPVSWRDPLLSAPGGADRDAAAILRCFADAGAVYLAVTVDAPEAVFASVPYGEAWRNDAVEFYFSAGDDGGSKPPAGSIRISADGKGNTIAEGFVAAGTGDLRRRFGFPFLWEALGVRAALERRPDGYTVEMALPREAVGWTHREGSGRYKLNVRVFHAGAQSPASWVLGWSEDPYNTSPESDEFYTSIRFTPASPVERLWPAADSSRPLRAIVLEALDRLADFDPAGALSLLVPAGDDFRVWPMLASTYLAAGQPSQALGVLSGIIASGTSGQASIWAMDHLALAHLRNGNAQAARELYQSLASSESAASRDLGSAGLIDMALLEDGAGAMEAIWKAQAGGSRETGIRTASRMGRWLRGERRPSEAASVYARAAESRRLSGIERSWALSQLQLAQFEARNFEAALEAGWKLQAGAAPGDPAAATTLAALADAYYQDSGELSGKPPEPFTARFLRLMKEKGRRLGPARSLVLADLTRREGRPESAAGICRDLASSTTAPRSSRSEAMLKLQQLELQTGKPQSSIQTGLKLQQLFPEAVKQRVASMRLLVETCTEAGTPGAVRQQCGQEHARLVGELRAAAGRGPSPGSALAARYLAEIQTARSQEEPRNAAH